MHVHNKRVVWLAALGVTFAPACALSQNLHNMVASRARVMPQVNNGIIAMREDASGRVYVLENPGRSVLIFDAAGNAVGQIPSASASPDTVRVAVDFDVAANGNVVIADRGSNAVEVFGPDGSLKSKVTVFAPTSVVALSNSQFAVTTLRTEHPVEVIDQAGRVVRGFGESHQYPTASDDPVAPPPPLADTGRVVGDSADNLYFALFSDTEPQIRKYDRFGYAAYVTAVPTPVDIDTTPDDRVQLGFNFARLSRSSQVNAWTTLGDSGTVNFGSNVGTGLSGLVSGGGRRMGRGGGGNLAGTITAQTSLKQPEFSLHMGAKGTGLGGRGSATGTGTQGSSSTSGSTAALQYGTSPYFQDNSTDPTDTAANAFDTIQYQGPGGVDTSNTVPGAVDYIVGTPQPGSNAGVGGFSSYFLGALGPRAGGFGRPFGGPGRGIDLTGQANSAKGTQGAAGDLPKPGSPESVPGGRGRFGESDLSFAFGLKLNLDKPRPPLLTEKKLTAIGVDHKTQEVWAAIGSLLIHFSHDGDAAESFYLTTPGGAALKTTAIVVEPDRLLIGSGSGGIYEFARPDKPTAASAVKASTQSQQGPKQ